MSEHGLEQISSVESIGAGMVPMAIIIYHDFQTSGIHFFTPNYLSQQLAYMRHPPGKNI